MPVTEGVQMHSYSPGTSGSLCNSSTAVSTTSPILSATMSITSMPPRMLWPLWDVFRSRPAVASAAILALAQRMFCSRSFFPEMKTLWISCQEELTMTSTIPSFRERPFSRIAPSFFSTSASPRSFGWISYSVDFTNEAGSSSVRARRKTETLSSTAHSNLFRHCHCRIIT